MSQFDELPDGWEWVNLSDISVIKSGLTKGKRRKDTDELKEVPYLRVANVQRGYLDLDEIKLIEATHLEIENFILRKGDILFTEGGDRDKLGRGWIWDEEILGCIHQNHIFRARLYNSDIDPRLISFYSNTHGQKYFLGEGRQTTNLASINLGKLSQLPIPLPPVNEQRRIVEKIEALTARSRKARAALDEIPVLLDQFRQSVLAAAFRGDLTADWRAQNSNVEPVEALLERIRVERRAHWEEAELEKMRTKGKEPKDDEWKDKYKELKTVQQKLFPNLPRGWCWISVEELASDLPRSLQSGPFGSNLKHEEFQSSGILAIGIDNVQEGQFSLGRQNRISFEKYQELKKYTARPLDVLITVMATVGKCCVVPEDTEIAVITKHVYRASLEQKLVDSYFLMNALRGSKEVLDQIEANIQGQTRPGINGQILRQLVIPVPPKEEQEAILATLSQYLKSMEYFKSLLHKVSLSSSQLDQSILAKAFRGELVPQDPNDEPAAVLLDRIRAERERLGSGKKRSKAKA